MIRYGIKLEDKMYNKEEVQSLLEKVVDGMLNEDIIKLANEIKNSQGYQAIEQRAS